MSETYDSDCTYCSEAEEVFSEQNTNKLPLSLRRSQRLLQKLPSQINSSMQLSQKRKSKKMLKRKLSEDILQDFNDTLSGQIFLSQGAMPIPSNDNFMENQNGKDGNRIIKQHYLKEDSPIDLTKKIINFSLLKKIDNEKIKKSNIDEKTDIINQLTNNVEQQLQNIKSYNLINEENICSQLQLPDFNETFSDQILLSQKTASKSNNDHLKETKSGEYINRVNATYNIGENNSINLTKKIINIIDLKDIKHEKSKCKIDEKNANVSDQNDNVEKQLQKMESLNSFNKKNTRSRLHKNIITPKQRKTPKSNLKQKPISKQRKITVKKPTTTSKCSYRNSTALPKQTVNYIKLTDIGSTSNKKNEIQIINNLPKQYYNMNLYKPPSFTLNAVRNSQLPEIYPAHFEHQLHPTETAIVPRNRITSIYSKKLSSNDLMIMPQANGYPLTPEFSQTYEIDVSTTSSSTLSLPESLQGVFDSNNIREILNAEKNVYHLNEHHTKVLALVLDINLEHLNHVLDKLVKLDNSVLQEVEKAYSNFTDSTDNGSTARTRPFKMKNHNENPVENVCVRDNKRIMSDAWFSNQKQTP